MLVSFHSSKFFANSGSGGLSLASLSVLISRLPSLLPFLVAPGDPAPPPAAPHPAGRPKLLQTAMLRENSRAGLPSPTAAPSSAQARRGDPAGEPRTAHSNYRPPSKEIKCDAAAVTLVSGS